MEALVVTAASGPMSPAVVRLTTLFGLANDAGAGVLTSGRAPATRLSRNLDVSGKGGWPDFSCKEDLRMFREVAWCKPVVQRIAG